METPLETASRIGWLEGVEMLLDHGVSPRHEKRAVFRDSPCALLWACKKGREDVVKVLLEKGADVECFHKVLLEKGADVECFHKRKLHEEHSFCFSQTHF